MISVLMGVYNAEKTLQAAINSIIQQTYKDWELIIYDDGSEDASWHIAQEEAEKDSRIIALRDERNHGLGYALNRCFEQAKGQFIARMDADDESLPERFETELSFLLGHPEYDIVSSAVIFFDENGDIRTSRVTETPQPADLIAGSPIIHPACMMRRKCLEEIKGYSEDSRTIRVEDADLWIRLYEKGYHCYNLPISLYRYRFGLNSIRRQKLKYRLNGTRVRWDGCRRLRLPAKYNLLAIRPIIIGLIPAKIRYLIHKKK